MARNERPVVFVSMIREGKAKIRVDMSASLLDFQYTDSDRKADKVRFTVENDDLRHMDNPLWRKGAELEVRWGYTGNVTPPRLVIVSKVTGARRLTIEGLGKESLLTKRKKLRRFRDKTRSEVAAIIAAEYDYTPDTMFIDPTKERFETITQNRSDGELLQRLAHKEGFQYYLDFDGFHWHPRPFGQKPGKTYIWGAASTAREAVLDFNVKNDVTRSRYKVVTVKGINPTTGEVFTAVGSNSVSIERKVLADHLDNLERVSRQSIDPADIALEELTPDEWFTEDLSIPYNVDNITDAENVIELIDPESKETQFRAFDAAYDPVDVTPTSEPTQEAAQTQARKRYVKGQQVAVKLTLTVIGDPYFSAKSVFQFTTPAKRITGKYYAKEVVHTISGGGPYQMSISAITDGENLHGKRSAGEKNNKVADDASHTLGQDPALYDMQEVETINPITKVAYKYWIDGNGRDVDEFQSFDQEDPNQSVDPGQSLL